MITGAMFMTSLFYLNQQNMKQPTQVFKINAVLLYHFKLRIKKKTEGMLLMYNLFVKIGYLPHRFTANFLLMEFIEILRVFTIVLNSVQSAHPTYIGPRYIFKLD